MLARLTEQLRVYKPNSEMFCPDKYNDPLSFVIMRLGIWGEEILASTYVQAFGCFPHITCLIWMQTGRKLFTFGFELF